MIEIPKLRWLIVGALFLSTAINYIARFTLPTVVGKVLPELGMTEKDYAQVVFCFLVAYTIMYSGSGYILDRIGTRISLTIFMLTWSTVQILTGFTRGKWSLASLQFLLGLAEPGNFPAGVKAVQEWFPANQRVVGVGIFNAGSSLGALLGAPIAAYFAIRYGWRTSFFFTGILGFFWVLLWLSVYPRTGSRRWLSAQKDNVPEVLKDEPEAIARATGSKPDVLRLLRSRRCYMLILARFLTDPVYYFILFWFPRYLEKARGFDTAMVGEYTWVPFLFEGVGYIFGGWCSARLIHAGWSLPKSRKFSMLFGACLLPAAMLTPFVSTASMAIAVICIALFGNAIWVANLQTLPADMFEANEVGTVAGFSGTGGGIGGAIASLVTGYIVMQFSFKPIFLLAGLMNLTAAALIFWLLPDRYFQKTGVGQVSLA